VMMVCLFLYVLVCAIFNAVFVPNWAATGCIF
jgi:hypothetical protein